jgi:NAD-dependent dihydropyrimidine dehydrogenase PreA subunit
MAVQWKGDLMAHRLVVDGDACTACGACADVCFVNAIGWDDDADAPVLAYPEDCQVCCVCERACPGAALTIEPDWASRRPLPYLSAQAKEAAG